MDFSRIRRGIVKKIYSRFKPVRLAKMIGVNFIEGGLHIYGQVDWGSEPWIITMGDNIHITEGAKFITHDGGTLLFRHKVPDLEITKPIQLGSNIYIGNNVILLPGVNIGNNVVIGAGAVVSKNIPDNSVAVGVPARVIKSTEEYYQKLLKESLHLGNLKGEEKDKALRKYFGYSGNSNGIYF